MMGKEQGRRPRPGDDRIDALNTGQWPVPGSFEGGQQFNWEAACGDQSALTEFLSLGM